MNEQTNWQRFCLGHEKILKEFWKTWLGRPPMMKLTNAHIQNDNFEATLVMFHWPKLFCFLKKIVLIFSKIMSGELM